MSLVFINGISYYEVLNFDFNPQDEQTVINFLQTFTIIDISMKIINQSLINRKAKKIKMADNFILATAQIFKLEIVSRNTKDFLPFLEKIINPFD